MLGVRQVDLDDLAAEPLDRLQGPLEDVARTPASITSPAELRRDAEAQALQVLAVGQPAIPPSSPTEVESQGSRPCSDASSSAASVTSRVSGPHWSSEEAKAIIP